MKHWLVWYYRRGLIIGAVAGLGFAWWLIQNDYNTLAQVFQASKGLLDSLMSRSAAAEIETAKIYVFFAGIGASIGFLSEFVLMRILYRR